MVFFEYVKNKKNFDEPETSSVKIYIIFDDNNCLYEI